MGKLGQQRGAVYFSMLYPPPEKSAPLRRVTLWIGFGRERFPVRCHLSHQPVDVVLAHISEASQSRIDDFALLPVVGYAQWLRKVAGSWILKEDGDREGVDRAWALDGDDSVGRDLLG